MSPEPIITCPSCKTEIKVTESLAAPLISATKAQYEKRLAEQSAEFTKRQAELNKLQESLGKEKESLDATIASRLKDERAKAAADAQKREKEFAEREAALLKEKEGVDAAVAEKLKAERARAAAEAQKREKEFAEREAALVKEKESVDSAVAEKLKAERAKAAAEAEKREKDFAEREAALAKEKENAEAAIAAKLKSERAKIAADEAKKAQILLGNDLEQKVKEIADLNAVLKTREEKLAEAQKAQAQLIVKERELNDAKREMDLTIETRVQESLTKTREQAKQEAEQALSLKLIEKEQTISSMQQKIEELKKKAEQGSQQLQGEALELQLESILSSKFPVDLFEPVPKGEHGGDILHRVNGPTGSRCGTILWESKRTKNWSDGWLPKLRDDQRAAKAEIAIIVSVALPPGIETFDQIDGVWIVHPKCVLPVAMSLRHMLHEVNSVRIAGEGQQSKMELTYRYLTGPNFRMRVEAIVEAFNEMQADLLSEKKAIQRQWAKREKQIERMVDATVGMYGDLQGIAGKSMREIDGLSLDTEDRPELPHT